jgi:predicted transposase/invertase (TIGR01784 family)
VEYLNLSGKEQAMVSALEKELDRQYYERLTAHLDGRAEGFTEGRTKTRYEIATNALSQGMSVEAVAKITGLTAEEVTACADVTVSHAL